MFSSGIIFVFLAYIQTTLLLQLYIYLAHKYSFGYQHLRPDGPQSHLITKKNIPTGAGLLIASAYCFYDPTNTLSNIFLIFSLIGFIDDYLKIRQKTNIWINVFVGILMCVGNYYPVFFKTHLLFKTSLLLPILSFIFLQGAPLKQKGLKAYQKLIMQLLGSYVAVNALNLTYPSILFITGVSNAVNISDGLDGLITVPLLFIFLYYLNYDSSIYALICISIGALTSYLQFNFPRSQKPRKLFGRLFMGDSGSLAYGALIACIALKTHTPFKMITLGAVFLINILSVILQVLSFKLRGKRIFPMAPLHHALELKGWSEQKIVFSIWAMQLALLLFTYSYS